MNSEDICTKCIIPKTAHSVKFDKDGYCELCNNDLGEIHETNNEENIKNYIDEIKRAGEGRDYDCLVGVSGGRDSAYLLHVLVTKHNLRCLAAYYKTPFTPEVIDENVKMLTKKLDVPLVEMDISRENHKNLAQKMMLLWMKKPNNIIANLTCASCKQVNHEIYKIAKKNNIAYIVYGGTKIETFQIGVAQSKKSKINELKEVSLTASVKQMIKVALHGTSILFQQPKLFLDLPALFKASILHLNPHTPYLRLRYPDIKMTGYYYIAGYDEKVVNKFLSDVDWKIPDNCNSIWRSDCAFNELKNYMFKKGAGLTYVDAYMSNMVRVGILTQEEALKRAKVEGKISQDRIKEVCDILEIPTSSFQDL